MPRTAQEHRRDSSIGSHESWARTADRTARTANGRAASPSQLEWHVARLDPERFADATDEQKLAAAESARTAYFARLALASHKARGRKNPTPTK
jgi:hypothetical protein